MVYQENMLNEHFTVAENILYKSNYGTTFGFYSKNKVNQHVKEYLEKKRYSHKSERNGIEPKSFRKNSN